MAMLSSPVSTTALSLFRFIPSPHSTRKFQRNSSLPVAASSSSSSASHESQSATKTEKFGRVSSANAPLAESPYGYALANPNGSPVVRFLQSTESTIERVIFDFRFLALLAIGGSLAGSVLCFLNGCVYIFEAYKVYWTSCVKGIHSGQMVLRLVEAIDVYLAGTVMLIFGMGLYGLFISNVPPDVPPAADRALTGSSLFGMFAMKVNAPSPTSFSYNHNFHALCSKILKSKGESGPDVQERPKWMKISSLDELKTKVGHVIVMILLVKMFERSKMVNITTGLDLLSYSVCIFLSSASLYILHNLHKSE